MISLTKLRVSGNKLFITLKSSARFQNLTPGQRTTRCRTLGGLAGGSRSSGSARTLPLGAGIAATAAFGLFSFVAINQDQFKAQCEEGGETQKDTSPSTDEEKDPYTLLQKCMAEAIGTGIIVSGGCGAVCASKFGASPLSLMHVATAFGISVALAVYTTRDVSGAHLNPAITASLAVNNPESCPPSVAVPYVLAQMAGATAAAALNFAAYRHGIDALHVLEKVKRGSTASSGLFSGAFHLLPNKSLIKTNPGALFAEIVMTACLAFAVYAITDEEKTVPPGAAPALIGATVAALVVPGAPLTGCGMNPARDLGPRLVAATFGGLGGGLLTPGWWVYTLGPVAGGIAGGALYNATLRKKKTAHQ